MSTAFPNEPTGATNRLDNPMSSASGFDDVYGTTVFTTDSTAPLSPSGVARHRLEAGAIYGGGQMHYYLPSSYSDMFVGMWWKLNAGFSGRVTADKMFFMRGADSNGFFGLLGGPKKGGPFYLYFGHNSGNVDNSHTMAGDLGLIGYPNVGPATVTPGQWFKIEAYIKASTTLTSRDGIVRWWVNGVLAGNYTNINYGPSGLSEWIWTETWDGSGDMGTSNTVPWEHYIDHLYISTGGSGSGGSGGGGGGGGGGTPQVLPAPGNLYPNGVTLPYGLTTFSWDAVPGAAQYAVRIHKLGDPYEPESIYLYFATQGSAIAIASTAPSSQYDWWVHAVDGSGNLGPSNGALLTTTASSEPPPPNPDPPPDPPPPPPVEPPVEEPPPVVIPPVVTPPDSLPAPPILGTATIIVTVKDRQNPIKKEFHFYG